MAHKSFEDLEVRKEACRLSLRVYELFADSKEYFLRDQIMRSALSIPSNIAEGSERNSPKDFIRFLHIAKGSSAELRTQLYLATKMGLIDIEKSKEMIEETRKVSSKLDKLIKSIEPKT